MTRKQRSALIDRVARAATAAHAARDYVSPVDVLIGIGWLDPTSLERWRRGQVDCLEEVVRTNPSRAAEALALLQAWAAAEGLDASETNYVARTPRRQALRFSESGDPATEQFYRTHWVSPELPAKQRERLEAKTNRPPELLVIQPLNTKWTCHRCGGTGDLLIMVDPGPECLRCAGLDDLEFLPSGDALLTRRARANSSRSAVVVRFSRTRGRYERQGLLVEKPVLADFTRDLEKQRGG